MADKLADLEYEKLRNVEEREDVSVSKQNRPGQLKSVDIAPALGELTTACNVGQAKLDRTRVHA